MSWSRKGVQILAIVDILIRHPRVVIPSEDMFTVNIEDLEPRTEIRKFSL